MIVTVVGGGAVGTFLGATLATAGHDVVLLRRGGPTGRERASIAVHGPGASSTTAHLSVAGASEAVTPLPDVVVLAVKMPDLPGAIEAAASWPEAPLLAVGNGVGADDMLREARISDLIAGSLTTAIVLDRPAGTVHRLSRGGIGLASVRRVGVEPIGAAGHAPVAAPPDRVVEELAAGFVAGGLRARVLGDAASMRWSKLLANLLGNATSAILDIDPADVYRDPSLFDVERRQLREALAVMRGLRLAPLALPGADVRPLAFAGRLPSVLVRPVMLRMVGRGRGGKSPSLRLHLQAGGGESEVEWLNGAVARAAIGLGRRAPVNARLAKLVEECGREPERWAWFRGHPGRLIAEMPGT
jgi:2-dehydropantoate 2-reductase